jgi:diguanylate cyclase (GGDEF)-like protein
VFKDLFIRLGIIKSTLVVTVLAILISVLMTVGLSALSGEGAGAQGILIAVIVPTVISTLFSYTFFGLLFQLDAAEKQLLELTRRDDLTGVYNRTYFIELAERELARCKRYGNIFSIAIVDVDDFKQVNDTFGHLAGDQVLQIMTSVFLHHLRQTDTVARFGGDEFVLLLPYASQEHALGCIERIRCILENSSLTYAGQEIRFTVSVGTATYDGQSNLDMVLQLADKALYEAKKTGKNRAVAIR